MSPRKKNTLQVSVDQSSNQVSLSDTEIPTLLNIAFKFVDYINFYWSFYLGFTGLGLGWLLSSNAPFLLKHKISLSILFVLATSMNLFPLLIVYKYFQSTIEEMTECSKKVATQTASFKKFLEKTSVVGGWKLAVVVHLMLDMVVLYCVWFWKK